MGVISFNMGFLFIALVFLGYILYGVVGYFLEKFFGISINALEFDSFLLYAFVIFVVSKWDTHFSDKKD